MKRVIFIRKLFVTVLIVLMSVVFSAYSIGESSGNMFLHTNQHNTFEDYYTCVLTLYDKEGNIKWNISWDNISEKPGVISEKPVFDEDTVYTFVGERMYSIDVKSGEINWSRELRSGGKSDFQVSGDCIYLTEDLGQDVIKINKNTGEIIWSSSGDVKNYGSKLIDEAGDIIIVKYIDYDRCGIFDEEGNFITYKESDEIYDYFQNQKEYLTDKDYQEINDDNFSSAKAIESGDMLRLEVSNDIKKIEIYNDGKYRESLEKGIDVSILINDKIKFTIYTNGDGLDTIQFSQAVEVETIKIAIESENSKVMISEIKLY